MFDKLKYSLSKPTCCTKCGQTLERIEKIIDRRYDKRCGGEISHTVGIVIECPDYDYGCDWAECSGNGHAHYWWTEVRRANGLDT